MSVRVFSSSKILFNASVDSELLEFEDTGVGTSGDFVTAVVVDDTVDFEVNSGENAVLVDETTGEIELVALVDVAVEELETMREIELAALVVDAIGELETMGEIELALVVDAIVELTTIGEGDTVVELEETTEAKTVVDEAVDDKPDDGDWLD